MRKIYIILFLIIGVICYSQTQTDPKSTPKTTAKPVRKPVAKPATKQKSKLTLKMKKEEKLTDFGIGAGLTRSVIFLSRNIKEFNDAKGYCFNLTYGGHKLIRFTAEYAKYNTLNIEPTWYDIKAKTYEANIHFLARFKNNKGIIFPIVGLSLNEFKGFFTGRDDFQNLRDKYSINSEVKSFWLGANFGLGYEHKIGPVKLVVMYKMRVGAADANERLNIMDVCYNFGLRYDIRVLRAKYIYRRIMNYHGNRYAIDF